MRSHPTLTSFRLLLIMLAAITVIVLFSMLNAGHTSDFAPDMPDVFLKRSGDDRNDTLTHPVAPNEAKWHVKADLLQQYPSDKIALDEDLDCNGYLMYHPHSGFSNQVLALKTALSLAYILKRTLIVPPAMLGARCTLDWRPYPMLSIILDDIYSDFRARDAFLGPIHGKAAPANCSEKMDQFVQFLVKDSTFDSCSREAQGRAHHLFSSYLSGSNETLSYSHSCREPARTLQSCFLRRQKLMSSSSRPIANIYPTNEPNASSWTLLRQYQTDWELVPMSKLFALDSLPPEVKWVDHDVFLSRLSPTQRTGLKESSMVLPDFHRYHYQLWDDKSRDLSWRRDLVPEEFRAYEKGTRAQRKAFFSAPLKRGGWSSMARKYGGHKGSQMDVMWHAATRLNSHSPWSLVDANTPFLPEDDLKEYPVQTKSHYLTTMDLKTNILPMIKGTMLFSVGSLFGTARLRVRDCGHKGTLRVIDKALSFITETSLNMAAQRWLKDTFSDTKSWLIQEYPLLSAIVDQGKYQFLSLHLRGGVGGGFSYRVEKVLDDSLQYFSQKIASLSLSHRPTVLNNDASIGQQQPLLKQWDVYVATDIKNFTETKYYQTLVAAFRNVYSLRDVLHAGALEAQPSMKAIWERGPPRNLPDCASLYYPLLEQIIASYGLFFAGTPGSTFSSLIKRARLEHLSRKRLSKYY